MRFNDVHRLRNKLQFKYLPGHFAKKSKFPSFHQFRVFVFIQLGSIEIQEGSRYVTVIQAGSNSCFNLPKPHQPPTP